MKQFFAICLMVCTLVACKPVNCDPLRGRPCAYSQEEADSLAREVAQAKQQKLADSLRSDSALRAHLADH
jgi:hypothetical protein